MKVMVVEDDAALREIYSIRIMSVIHWKILRLMG